MFYMAMTSFYRCSYFISFVFLEILGTLGGHTCQGWKQWVLKSFGPASQKERETLSGKYVQTGDMPGEGCLILCPSCNVCIIGDGQMLANNKNYFKLENVNHSPWNLARILVLFHIVPTQVRLSAGL